MGANLSTNRVRIEIINSAGLHPRAALRFVRVASRFRSAVTVARDGRSADGKSILDLMMLAAMPGKGLDIGAIGPDCDEALTALSALIGSGPDDPRDCPVFGWEVDA